MMFFAIATAASGVLFCYSKKSKCVSKEKEKDKNEISSKEKIYFDAQKRHKLKR
jgi:hypothetical protein